MHKMILRFMGTRNESTQLINHPIDPLLNTYSEAAMKATKVFTALQNGVLVGMIMVQKTIKLLEKNFKGRLIQK